MEFYTKFFVARNNTLSSDNFLSKSLRKTTDKLHLDLDSIMKSTQVIFSKVRLEELVSALLKIAIENAGATRGVLLLS